MYTVKRYSTADWPRLLVLLDQWPFKHAASYLNGDSNGPLNLTASRVALTLGNSESASWVAERAQGLSGFAASSPLAWDSELLGVQVARLDYLLATGSYAEQYEIKRVLLDRVLEQARYQGIEHLNVRIDARDLSSLHLLEQAGFITVDGILTFALDVRNLRQAPLCDAINVRIGGASDGEATAQLARTAYVYDRFHADPAVPVKRSNDLHAAWMQNSCAGLSADVVMLAEDQDGLLGFVTGKLQHDTKHHLGKLIGTIVLVATHERARGRGVARRTTISVVDWFRQQGADIVEVGTQLANISASRLYQACGFSLVGSSISLRKLLQKS